MQKSKDRQAERTIRALLEIDAVLKQQFVFLGYRQAEGLTRCDLLVEPLLAQGPVTIGAQGVSGRIFVSVRFHGRPAFLLERANPGHEVVSLSWLVTNRLLFLFALADTRGRNTSETGRPEENLHLWKMVAEENGCFDQPYPFANDQARFLFHRQRQPDLHYVPREEYVFGLTVCRSSFSLAKA